MKKLLSALNIPEPDSIKAKNAYFSRSDWMQALIASVGKPVTFAGELIAREKKGKVKPSAHFLQAMATQTDRIATVNEKAAWLFVCGRDIQGKNVTRSPRLHSGDLVLVCNAQNECLGYGKVHVKKDVLVTIHNIYDIGDYLRRES